MKNKVYRLTQSEKELIVIRLKEFLEKQPLICFAYLYGSFIDDIAFHDIDIGIYLRDVQEEESAFQAIDFANTLSKIIKFPVDVRIFNFAPVTFCYHVIQGVLLIDKSPDQRTSFMEDAIRSYLDLKPLLYRATKEAFAA